MRILNFAPGIRKIRKNPDRKIIITKTIVIVEYNNNEHSADLMLPREDKRAQKILETIVL